MRHKRQYCGFIIVNFVLLITFLSDVSALERRRDQFSKEPGHYIIPMPYSLPGVGEGLLLGGAINNAHDGYTDYIGFIITGDLEGAGLIAKDIHLINERLIADVYAQRLDKGTIRNYNGRGMTSGKDDYGLVEFRDNRYAAARLTGTFYDRMLEINGAVLQTESHLASIRDRNGELIQEASGDGEEYNIYTAGITLDWTDDYLDPRKGIRYNLARWWRAETAAHATEFYQQEHNLTGYIPIGRLSTWAFNYFRADAHVTRLGDTDFASVEARQGLNCDDLALTSEQQTQCTEVVNNIIANNRYGTVGGIGGHQRLRSYPNGRYKGAHVIFYGTEFRWNLTEEFRPFNIGIAKDVRTGIQLAFFYETATVADKKDELGNIWRDSYGLGVRMVTASGLVIRGDYATGDEGEELTVIFGYPWEGF